MLVAGIGNVFRTDDGFGPEVARRLSALTWPDGVRVVDYGIRGLHLAYDLNPANRTLQTVAKVARPAVVVALDWVLDTGARQFGHSALGER